MIAPAECSSNLSRFDGVRYGHRAAEYGDLADLYAKSRAEGFGAEVKRRILVGTYVLSHGYYDAYYLQAQRLRRLIAQDFQAALQHCDLIAGPTTPTTAWALGEKADDPVQMYLSDIYTIAVNLAGLPGLSHPAGFGADGLPVGLQLIGDYFAETRLLNAAHRFQQATDWHAQPAGMRRVNRMRTRERRRDAPCRCGRLGALAAAVLLAACGLPGAAALRRPDQRRGARQPELGRQAPAPDAAGARSTCAPTAASATRPATPRASRSTWRSRR